MKMRLKSLKNLILFLFTFTIVFISGCENDISIPNKEGYSKVYIPAAAGGLRELSLKISEVPDTLLLGAAYGGFDFAAQDIQVAFSVDPAAVDSFNIAHGTDYHLLPEGSYTLESNKAVIPKGTTHSEALEVLIDSKKIEIFKFFILPISIKEVSAGFTINRKLETIFYRITILPEMSDYANYDRSEWKVIEFSSERPNNEKTTGLASMVIDSDPQTNWYTSWGQFNGHVTIDMGQEKVIHGIGIRNRDWDGLFGKVGNGQPKVMKISVSLDNVTWIDVGTITDIPFDAEDPPEQRFFVTKFEKARYIRYSIVETYRNKVLSLAEVYAF